MGLGLEAASLAGGEAFGGLFILATIGELANESEDVNGGAAGVSNVKATFGVKNKTSCKPIRDETAARGISTNFS